uniref:Methyltransferase FkbM domain-containing protein n=1 Tax=Aureoumbra lagunensis TaxID=44058 RepID=A0A7S3NK39_9STRA
MHLLLLINAFVGYRCSANPGYPEFVVFHENNVAVTRGRYGLSVTDTSDKYVGDHLRMLGEWEQPIMDTAAELVKEGETVWDLGAHCGAHSIGLASMVGKSGRVHAFEPQRDARLLLSASIALNSLSNTVHVHAEALGNHSDHGGRLTTRACEQEEEQSFTCIEVLQNNTGALSLSHQEVSNQGNILVASLDQLFFSQGSFKSTTVLDRGCPRLIKSDVEGMDLRMIAGAEKVIAECRPYLLFETMAPRRIWPELRYALLDRHPSYRCSWLTFRINPPANRAFRRSANGLHETNALGPMSYNALCIHGDSPERLAPKARAAGHLLPAYDGATDLIYSGSDCSDYEAELKAMGQSTFSWVTGIDADTIFRGALSSICIASGSSSSMWREL